MSSNSSERSRHSSHTRWCLIYVKKERQSLKAIRNLNLLTSALQCGIMDRNNTKTVAVESSQGYKMLTRYEAEILRAAIPDVLGEDRGLPPVDADRIVRWIDTQYLAKSTFEFRLLYRFLILALQFLFPLLFGSEYKIFLQLSPEEKQRLFNKWAQSRLYLLRNSFTIFRLAICFAYYGQDEVSRAIGYDAEAKLEEASKRQVVRD